MAQLAIQAAADGNPGGITLQMLVSDTDGQPVVGLSGNDFAVKLIYGADPTEVVDVPTTFTDPNDEAGTVTSLVEEQGLPGFYNLGISSPPGWHGFPKGMSYGIQVRVQSGADQGQALTNVTILTPV